MMLRFTAKSSVISGIIVTFVCSTFLLRGLISKDHDMAKDMWITLPDDALAIRLSPDAILSLPVASGSAMHTIPKYIHQSWMVDELPARMSRWSQTCRAQNHDWQWILWTNEDNLRMVKTYFPWFLDTYRALPAEINRADVSRNMYMYMFGGIYADLDTECLQPFEGLFQGHHVPLTNSVQSGHIDSSPTGPHVAFFGRMGFDGTDNTLYHTIPNAWMAATPGHPFFLLVLERLKEAVEASRIGDGGVTAETLTGPVALYLAIEEYGILMDGSSSFTNHFAANPSYQLFNRTSTDLRMKILPPENIYPYSWNNQGIPFRGVCWAASRNYNSQKCKQVATTDQSYAITYWSHTWE